jgi:catechol 2,3-dioxygenase-like lactoylglutathione lyase family enzyme
MLRRAFLVFAALALATARGALAADPGSGLAVDSIGRTVSELDRSVDFYTRVLDFEKLSESEVDGADIERLYGVFGARVRLARLRLGSEYIELMEFLAPQGRPAPADARSNDRWFQHIAIVVRDMDEAYRHLRAHRVRHASTGPQRLPDWNRNAGGIQAFYFRDPDGHPVEVIWFPPGKGDPRWQQPSQKLFLGIDHTAIVTGDTASSLRFYRDVLGMRVAGESENYGIEQERLNNVFGARLRITGLQPASGPGVEFLEYLAPAGGRAFPADSHTNDLWHTHTAFRTERIAATDEAARAAHAGFVSPGVVAGAMMLRDPDGHPVLVKGN